MSGLCYTATVRNVSIPNSSSGGTGPPDQTLWEISAALTTSVSITLIQIRFQPIVSVQGVDVPGFAQVIIANLAAAGTGEGS